ncbi:MAG: hypothetical protein AAGA76_00870 [Pseudomonadota bacterium]
MQTTSKLAALFVAATLSLAPATAFASVGDNMFSWPTGFSQKNTVKQEKANFGAVESLRTFAPVKDKREEKKQ